MSGCDPVPSAQSTAQSPPHTPHTLHIQSILSPHTLRTHNAHVPHTHHTHTTNTPQTHTAHSPHRHHTLTTYTPHTHTTLCPHRHHTLYTCRAGAAKQPWSTSVAPTSARRSSKHGGERAAIASIQSTSSDPQPAALTKCLPTCSPCWKLEMVRVCAATAPLSPARTYSIVGFPAPHVTRRPFHRLSLYWLQCPLVPPTQAREAHLSPLSPTS